MTPTDGATEYTTCEGLLTQSSSTWPKMSVCEIIASRVSANKLVISKPATTKDATNSFMDTTTLAGCCYDRGGFPGDTLDRVRKYGVNAQELVTTSSTRLLMTT